MARDAWAKLDAREAEARLRVRAAARDLKDSLVAAAGYTAEDHPWALPAVGFCAGFLATFLVPDRRPSREENGYVCRR